MEKNPKSFLEVLEKGLFQYIEGDPKDSPVYCPNIRKNKSADRATCWRHDIPVNENGKRFDRKTGKELSG